MPDSPYGNMPAGPNPWMPQDGIPARGPSRAPAIIAIAIALVSLAVAVAGWFRPSHSETAVAPQYTEQQASDAKKNLCDAYQTALKGIQGAGSLSSEDPDQKFMLAISSRLAFNSAADYLMNQITLNNAAPPSLLDETKSLVTSYQKMILAHAAQAQKEELDPIYDEVHTHESAIVQECK